MRYNDDNDVNIHQRQRRCCRPRYVCLAFLLTIIVVCATWDRAWTTVVVYKVRDATANQDAHMERIQGLFPFDFSVPLINIPGNAKVTGLDVHYDGTYNPFRLASQTGPLLHGHTATVDVEALGTQWSVPIEHYNVIKEPDDKWHVSVAGHVMGHPMDVSLRWSGGNGATMVREANVTLDDGMLVITMTPQRVRVVYGVDAHVLLDVVLPTELNGNTITLNLLGDVARVVVEKLQVSTSDNRADVSIASLTSSVFDADPPVTLARDLRAMWHGTEGSMRSQHPAWSVAVDTDKRRIIVSTQEDGGVVTGTWDTPSKDEPSFYVMSFVPPLATPLGTIQHMDLDAANGAFVTWFDGGKVAHAVDPTQRVGLHIGPDAAIAMGPIRVAAMNDAIVLTIDGGHYDRFKCVVLHGSVRYEDPAVVVLDHVSVTTEQEQLHGSGTYVLPERKIRFSFDVEINT